MIFFISALFFIAFSMHLFIGLVVSEKLKKNPMHILLFFICISLSFWALGFSLSIGAPTEEVARFWRRFSALGWVSLYALLLHFSLYFTGILTPKNIKPSIMKFMIGLIYLPAAFLAYGYILSNRYISQVYVMKYTPFGWHNVSTSLTLPDKVFYVYYIGYMLVIVGLLLHWHFISKENTKISRSILISNLIAFFLGNLFDVFLTTVFAVNYVKITPILALLPIYIIVKSIRQDNFLNAATVFHETNIIGPKISSTTYLFVAISMMSGSIFNYLLIGTFTFIKPVASYTLLILSLLLFGIRKSKIQPFKKDFILVFFLFHMIVLASVYMLPTGGLTTWSGAILVIFMFAFFKKKNSIIYLTIALFLSQVITWSYSPSVNVNISGWDYALRTGMIALMVIFTIYINNQYLEKIKENELQIATQHHMAYYDSLTGLPNRTYFTEYLAKSLNKVSNSPREIAILFIDLDSFKIINDTKGHDIGDQVLKIVSRRLQSFIKRDSFIARFGGDEFLIIYDSYTNKDKLTDFCENLLDVFRKPIVYQAYEYTISASIGISLYPHDGVTENALISRADLAMYSAKEFGKNTYTFCTDEMKENAEKETLIIDQLRSAIDNKELTLVYQPQVDLETQMIHCCEALLRWNSPSLGPQSPGVFIPLAEKSNIIDRLGDWVLEEALRQNLIWHNLGFTNMKVSVNVSVPQLYNPGFLDFVQSLLDKYHMSPDHLELELTENIFVDDHTQINETLIKLSDLGVSIAIDDFGTGFSSLGRIRDLSVDILKLDMSFIRNLTKHERDRNLSKAIIDLADALNLKVIAEGVETKEQLDLLTSYGCRYIQGYYFFKPMPPAELTHYF